MDWAVKLDGSQLATQCNVSVCLKRRNKSCSCDKTIRICYRISDDLAQLGVAVYINLQTEFGNVSWECNPPEELMHHASSVRRTHCRAKTRAGWVISSWVLVVDMWWEHQWKETWFMGKLRVAHPPSWYCSNPHKISETTPSKVVWAGL